MLVFALIVVAVALILMGWVVGHFAGSRRNRARDTVSSVRTDSTGTSQVS